MSGGDTQQGPPPPPPPSKTAGSPFGRFLTSPVLLIGVVALVVGFATLSSLGPRPASGPAGGGGPPSTGNPPGGGGPPGAVGLAGTWTGEPASNASEVPVSISIAPDGTGTLTRGQCSGTLAPVTRTSATAVFEYTETSGNRGCPGRTQVAVELEAGALRFEERGRGGRPLVAGRLEAD